MKQAILLALLNEIQSGQDADVLLDLAHHMMDLAEQAAWRAAELRGDLSQYVMTNASERVQ